MTSPMWNMPTRDVEAPDRQVGGRCPACGKRVSRAGASCAAHSSGAPPESAPRPASGPVVLPSFPGYRALRLLGQGGFGAVFEAEPEAGGACVAIKLAHRDRPGAGTSLRSERRALAAIGPPFVPKLLGSGELADGSPFLVMQRVNGPQLSERLVDREGALPLAEVAALAPGILCSLEAVHTCGYIHRDLKPENIFTGEDRPATIIDFGLVLPARGSREDAADFAETGAFGTVEYMAPEQCDGRLEAIDVRTDIYAMGVILFEMLTGRPPFWGPPAAVRELHRGHRPPRPSALAPVPLSVERVVLRCLAKEPRDRYASVKELREAFEGALTEVGAKSTRMEAGAPSAPGEVGEQPSVRGEPAVPSSGLRRFPPDTDAPPSSGTERRMVGLVFFETDADVLAVTWQILLLGGQLAHASGRRCAAIYSHAVGDNPARRALKAAEELRRRGVCASALVDLAPVQVQTRPDGSRRFLSPLWERSDRYPVTGSAGVIVSSSASAVMDEVRPSTPPSAERTRVDRAGSSSAERVTALDGGAPRLFGREEILSSLLASAARVIEGGAPTIVRVTADPGYGKTLLCSTLLDRLRAQNGREGGRAHVIEIAASEPGVSGADRTAGELLRQALELPRAAPPDGGRAMLCKRLGARRARIAVAWPAAALSLGWLAPDAPELASLRAAPGAVRSALAISVGEALRRRSLSGPLLVVLDDAHATGEATLAALEFAALADAGVPVWVCAFGRPELTRERVSWGERAGRFEAHELGPLDPVSAAALCRELLLPARDVPESAIERLIARTQAVPLLLVELVRGLARGGIVRRDQRTGAWFVATDEIDRLPDLPSIEWLAHQELDALSPALRGHARLVSLLGAEVSIAEVEGVLRRLEARSHAADLPLDAGIGTARLLAAGLVVRQRQGRIAFRHALVREAVARTVPEGMRKAVHLAAFEHYRDALAQGGAADGAGGGDGDAASVEEERRLNQLALHAAAAGLVESAEEAYLRLAERACARHAYMDAELSYSRALDARALAARAAVEAGEGAGDGSEGASRTALLTARRGRGRMRYRLGRFQDALADLGAARALSEASGDVAMSIELLLDEATVLDWMAEYKASEERVEQAKALSSGVVSPLLSAELLLGMGRSLHRGSREEEAARLLSRAAEEAAALGEEGYETQVIAVLMLGFILPGLGRLDEAMQALSRAVLLCESHGDALHLGSAVINRALARACLGDKAGMVSDLEMAVRLARALGQGTMELVARFNMGEYLMLMDDAEGAEPHVRSARALEERQRGSAVRPALELLEARLLFFRGEDRGARALMARIREREGEARARGDANALMAPSEEVQCAMLDLATREASAAEWDALEERAALFSVGQERIEVLEARGLSALRRGHLEEARWRLEKALGAAAKIPNVMGERLRRELDEVEAQLGESQAAAG